MLGAGPKKGKTNAIRNSGLSRIRLISSDLYCPREGLQAIKDSHQQPKIGVDHKILVSTEAGVGHREKEETSKQKDCESEREPGCPPELRSDLPSRQADRKPQDN